MKLLTNSRSANHLSELLRFFSKAEEITVFVAYLSKSGFGSIEPSLTKAAAKAKSIEFYCGLDGCITDPEALRSLFKLLGRNLRSKCRLYLVETSRETFHPKIYLFKIAGSHRMVIGSANLTSGGLEQNWEASVVIDGSEVTTLLSDVDSFRKGILDVAKPASATRLSQYAQRHRIFSSGRKAADRRSQREANRNEQLDLDKLEQYLQKYRTADENGMKTFGKRVSNYRAAKIILDELAQSKVINKAEFIRLFGQLVGYSGRGALWWSLGLQRSRASIDSHYRAVIELIRAIKKDSKKSPEEVFRVAKPYIDRVKGLGINTATEIMSTYSPKTLAVLNENPIAGLEFFGCSKFGDANGFTPERYASFTEIMNDLRRACGFRSLAKADHFLNYIYWLKAKKQKAKKRATI